MLQKAEVKALLNHASVRNRVFTTSSHPSMAEQDGHRWLKFPYLTADPPKAYPLKAVNSNLELRSPWISSLLSHLCD